MDVITYPLLQEWNNRRRHTPYEARPSQNWPKITTSDHVHQIFITSCTWFKRGVLCDRGLSNFLSNCIHFASSIKYRVTFNIMMTSSNGNIFRVTGPLCGGIHRSRWIPHTKASDAELWCLLWSAFIQAQIKENIKPPRHWSFAGNSPGTGNAENVSIWWRHHVILRIDILNTYCVKGPWGMPQLPTEYKSTLVWVITWYRKSLPMSWTILHGNE